MEARRPDCAQSPTSVLGISRYGGNSDEAPEGEVTDGPRDSLGVLLAGAQMSVSSWELSIAFS